MHIHKPTLPRTMFLPIRAVIVQLGLIVGFLWLGVEVAYANVSQSPLFLGGRGLPGNMVLVPSVEFPTINSVANIDDSYSSTEEFVGYFDSGKCYVYVDSSTESLRYFKPNSLTTDRKCSGTGEWSGNFLNWAATQTIDPFRKVLTGGYRVRDTSTETWLEKARHDGQGGTDYYPIREVTNNTEVAGATPYNADQVSVRIHGLGSKMRFTYQVSGSSASIDMSVRVSVCDPSVGLEGNCVKYSDGWKPEGLIQQNATAIRFSIFGYLNDGSSQRDGGVLRAQQKYVGGLRLQAGYGFIANDNAEWDPNTGIHVKNPDSEDAEDTANYIDDSGVINYLNKFGQLTTNNHKGYDPVSELYYAATRYLKNQGDVSKYSNVTSSDLDVTKKWLDGFPVITDWDDPIEYACQKNVIIGIGDAYTHRDKNLPGNDTYLSDEPTKPGEISGDTSIDVIALTEEVANLEGLGNIAKKNSFSGRYNSAYIAGMAWNNNVRDMRPDLPGGQFASTHWVDVMENQWLEPIESNQYYLAAKYGGFKVPEEDAYVLGDPLEESWWHTNGEILIPKTGGGEHPDKAFKRPDNYYLAGAADKMVASMEEAFTNAAEEMNGSSTAVAANSTRLDATSAAYAASFITKRWSGDLKAFALNADAQGAAVVSEEPVWSASEILDDTGEGSRNIFTNGIFIAQDDDSLLADSGREFKWSFLEDGQRELLRKNADNTLVSEEVGESRLKYLRGDRSNEQTDSNKDEPFRQRDSVLGDIANSSPQFSHTEDFGYYELSQHPEFDFSGAEETYFEFQGWKKEGRPPALFVGSNDGMLHAFHASIDENEEAAGSELFAYVPSSVIGNLYRLSTPGYVHNYFVDGTPRIADAYIDDEWVTMLVGTTGGGGSSVFALDITTPDNFGESDVLWEFSHPEMGYTIFKSSVVPLNNGEFGVVVTSGYSDFQTNDGVGYIWILDAADGSIMASFETTGGGLGSPLLVDLDFDATADRLYVGDSAGKLWRIDLDDESESHWDSPFKQGPDIEPWFVEPNGRPITAPLTSSFNNSKKHMVFFGTGKFLWVGDNVVGDDPPLEYFYGLIDGDEQITTREDMLEQNIVGQGVFSGAPTDTPTGFRLVTDHAIDASHTGWYIPLAYSFDINGNDQYEPEERVKTGERVLVRPLVRKDRVIFVTMIPQFDPCEYGGTSWLMEVKRETGGRLNYTVFDYDLNGTVDTVADAVNGFVEGEGEPIRDGSGINLGIGIINTPTVITKADCSEVKLFSSTSGEIFSLHEAGSCGQYRWEQLR